MNQRHANLSYHAAVLAGSTHAEAVTAELTNLASVLTPGAPDENLRHVQDRLVSLSGIVKRQPPGPTLERVKDACRLLRGTIRGLSGGAPAVRSALRLLEG